MNSQPINELPAELTQAIDSIVATKAPADSVERVINRSIELAATSTSPSGAVSSPSATRYQFLMRACCLVAFLSPLIFFLFKNQLDVLPGWESPMTRVLIVAFVTSGFAALAWVFGRNIIGTTKQRSALTTRWLSNAATLVVFGLLLSSLLAIPSNLYAQMQETIAKMNTIQYVMTLSNSKTEQVSTKTKMYMQGSNLMRAEIGFDGVVAVVAITDLTQKKSLSLFKQEKKAELLPIYQAEKMKQGMNETDRFLRGVDANAKLKGDSKVDGHLCSNFEVQSEGVTSIVSIDKQTKLPVQIKSVAGVPGDSGFVINQFVFDEPLDPKLFSLKAPEGYKSTIVERKEAVDDSGLKLVLGEKFGSANFGMSSEEVIKVLGEPDQILDSMESDALLYLLDEDPKVFTKALDSREFNYRSRGFKLIMQDVDGLIAVYCLGGATGESVFQGEIEGGIKMGASPEDVRKQFGEPYRKPRLDWGESASDLNYKLANGSTVHFEFEDSKLVLVVNRKNK